MLYRASPKLAATLTFFIIINAIFPAIFIKTTANIIQIVSEKGEYNLLILQLVIWGFAMLGQNITSTIISYLEFIFADKLTFNIHDKIINKANSFQSVEIFDNKEFYNNLELIKTQSYYIPMNLLITLVGLTRDFIVFKTCVLLLYSVLGWKSILTIVCAALNAYIFVRIQTLMIEDSINRSAKSRFLNYLGTLAINTKYIKDLRFFGYGQYINNLYNLKADELYNESCNKRRKVAFKSFLPIIITALITVLLTFNITSNVYIGALAVSGIALLIQSLVQLQITVNLFGEQCAWIKGHLLFFQQYFDFLNTKQKSKNGEQLINNEPITIEFKNVSFEYSKNKYALQDINFKINAKDKIALVGANGAGKSTFIKLLCGLYLPTEGEILINGTSIRDLNLQEWRKHISPVFQDFATYDFTLKENITCESANENDITEVLNKSAIPDLVVNLSDNLGKAFGGIEFSGGQWQKIAIARALYNDGDIFILDEPTASLDPISESEIFKKFEEISMNKTVIFVTHRLNSVSMADNILLLDHGRIIDYGPHEVLMKRCKKYKSMFDKQAKYYIKSATNK